MAELLDIVEALSTPLKLAWAVWLAWGVAQVFWYRYERKPRPARQAVPARKPFVSKPSGPERAKTRLVTPEQVMPTEPPPAEPSSGNGPGTIGELDQFVARFEMNSRGRREQPLNGEPVNAPFGG
jgi:hypothetical protein